MFVPVYATEILLIQVHRLQTQISRKLLHVEQAYNEMIALNSFIRHFYVMRRRLVNVQYAVVRVTMRWIFTD